MILRFVRFYKCPDVFVSICWLYFLCTFFLETKKALFEYLLVNNGFLGHEMIHLSPILNKGISMRRKCYVYFLKCKIILWLKLEFPILYCDRFNYG
mmetsp:Transcript_21477/g.26309  ORF Transcript_21477/g.26309 Transcript_21477/m.26309 type:complete len:96 (+) Transcript_21477:169-456(+)